MEDTVVTRRRCDQMRRKPPAPLPRSSRGSTSKAKVELEAEELIWDEEDLSLKSFIANCSDALPKVAVVTIGVLGNDSAHTVDPDEVFLVYRIFHQPRAVLKSCKGTVFSLPLDYPQPLQTVVGADGICSQKYLKDFVQSASETGQCPPLHLDQNNLVTFWDTDNSEKAFAEYLGELTLVKEYSERHIVVMPMFQPQVQKGTMRRRSLVIPAYVGLRLRVSCGSKERTDDDFQRLLQTMVPPPDQAKDCQYLRNNDVTILSSGRTRSMSLPAPFSRDVSVRSSAKRSILREVSKPSASGSCSDAGRSTPSELDVDSDDEHDYESLRLTRLITMPGRIVSCLSVPQSDDLYLETPPPVLPKLPPRRRRASEPLLRHIHNKTNQEQENKDQRRKAHFYLDVEYLENKTIVFQ